MSVPTGHTFGGRYSVEERVGVGGMAEVYRARDSLLGREVAVKVLSERFSRDRSFVERFRREAQSAANLNHPNIVSLYDFGGDDSTYFIVMEYIDGSSLGDIIRQDGPLLPERAAEIASDVAQALQRAHSAGIVHRDIKPTNIMITSSGQTKVTDFGIARAMGDGEQTMTQTGMVIGTASYLAPEQAQGNPVDARSDVYALGCVLYEMLTGRPPFSGDTPLSIAYKHVRETPTPPSRVNSDVPAGLEAIVMKALAKNPENRYSSATEMHEDLERFLAGQRVHATPLMADETMVAPVTRSTSVLQETDFNDYDEDEKPRRGWWYLLLTLLILALFGLIAWFVMNNLLGEEAPPTVRVPDLVGKTESEARDILEDRGLKAATIQKNSNKPENEVIDQDPDPGEELEEGGTVELTVSSGPRTEQVPGLAGLTVEEAEQRLDDAHLELGGTTSAASDEVPEGQIISQDPERGEEVPRGTAVDVVVSSGPEAVTVPFVEGQPEDTAVEEIEGAGLVAEVSREPSNDVEEGHVIAQEPEGGSQAFPGDVVQIVVSEGPEEEPMPDVTGQDADNAQAQLEEDFGLEVTQEEETRVCAQPPGTVCRQDPDPGTPVSPGDSAVLYVQPDDAEEEARAPTSILVALG